MTCFNDKVSVVEEHEEMWLNLVKMIYVNLNEELLQNLGDGKEEEKEECRFIFGKVKSVSELLRTFPELLEKVLEKIKYFDQNKDDLDQ